MEAILFYLGKMILTSGLMFLYYQLFLKDKTFHHYNRFYLLGTMLVSLLLPLLKVSYFTIAVNNDIYLLINKLQPANAAIGSKSTSIYPLIFTLGLLTISVFFITRFVYGIFKIIKLKRRFPREAFEGLNFYQTDLEHAPFSYFRNLFWKNNIPVNSALGQQIMMHEMAHIEQKHTYDKILIETLRSVFWFNPFFHLIKKEVHLIHEYLADKKAIKQSDTKAFAQMLLASHFSGNTLPAASPFLNTHLKKRLQMIKTSKTKFSYARKAFALPLFFSVAFACVVHAQNRQIDATNHEVAETIEEIETSTAITKSQHITEIEEAGAELPDQVKQSMKVLAEHDTKIAGLDQKVRERMEELKTLIPDTEAFTLKIDEISNLSLEISELVNTEDFQNSIAAISEHARNYSAVLSKEDLQRIKEEAARASEDGAAAMEEARIAMKQAGLAREEAALMKEAAAEAKQAADMARKEAALAREEAARMKEQTKNRSNR